MSLSRKQVHQLESAGWEVVQFGPAVEVRRWLRSLFGRRPAAGAGR